LVTGVAGVWLLTLLIVTVPLHGVMSFIKLGAGEQNGSSDVKKQSSSSQAGEERSSPRYSGDRLGPRSGKPLAGLRTSSGSIPSSNSQRQQLRSVHSTDHSDKVQERRRQLEVQRQEALKKQMTEKERRWKRAQEIKGRQLSSKQPSARTVSKKTVDTPAIVIESASPEPGEPHKTKAKPTELPVSIKTVTSPKSVTSIAATSPTSPTSPKAE